MCQKNNREKTRTLRKELKAKGSITAYKVFMKSDKYYFAKYQETPYVKGVNTCNLKPEKGFKKYETYGIHVFLSRDDADETCVRCSDEVVVAVECKAEHFVSAGLFENTNTAVFTTITIHSFRNLYLSKRRR